MPTKKTSRRSDKGPTKYNAVICFQGGSQLTVSFASNALLRTFVTAYTTWLGSTSASKWIDCEVRTTSATLTRERLVVNFQLVCAINYAIDS